MTKPEPQLYYDIHDLVRYLKLSSIRDLLFDDEYPANGEMITFYEQCDEDMDSLNKNDLKVYKRRKQIFDEFGDIQVKVWW